MRASTKAGDPTSITDEKWRKVMSTDVDGVFYGCRAALPHLEKSKGSIVNTASVSGTGGDWGMSPYNAAKGAVVNLTRALALDMGKKGVRVNAVCPSLTRTGMTEDMMDDKELLAKFAEADPVGPRLRTGGGRRRGRVPRKRRRELHDGRQRSGWTAVCPLPTVNLHRCERIDE